MTDSDRRQLTILTLGGFAIVFAAILATGCAPKPQPAVTDVAEEASAEAIDASDELVEEVFDKHADVQRNICRQIASACDSLDTAKYSEERLREFIVDSVDRLTRVMTVLGHSDSAEKEIAASRDLDPRKALGHVSRAALILAAPVPDETEETGKCHCCETCTCGDRCICIMGEPCSKDCTCCPPENKPQAKPRKPWGGVPLYPTPFWCPACRNFSYYLAPMHCKRTECKHCRRWGAQRTEFEYQRQRRLGFFQGAMMGGGGGGC